MPHTYQQLRLSVVAASLLLTLPLAAQTRSTVLVGPPALGATCYVRHVLPAGSVGHIAGFLWSGPFAGAVTVPGLAVNGLLRVDPTAFVVLGITLTNGVAAPSFALAVPSSPSLLGGQLDCQSFDFDLAGVFQLAGNDVALTVVDGPSAALGMVAIAPGTYQRGSPVTPLNVGPYFNQANAQPVHPVTISRPFWIGRFEVTQAQYQAVMSSNPSFFQGASYPNAAQRPVDTVSWNNAVAYCAALTASEQAAGRVPTGYVYRLPTEAEWEYCCRAGTTTEFHTGATLVCGQANFGYSYHSNTNCTINQTAVVGSYAPNAWGLHDMHGNVWEWCQDSWGFSTSYPSAAVTDPFVASGPSTPSRVFRGGSWNDFSRNCRSASRYGLYPPYTYNDGGFRVVLAPVLP
ncbi:MAG: formylglycine-generating enzyme family protein [Planctomycetota bacterium]